MKNISTLVFALLISFGVSAQSWVADSIEMGSGYSHDVYYDLSSGNDYRQVADDWDIAFQMTAFGDPMFNASVRANHIKRSVEVYSLHKVASTTFGTLTPADTMVNKADQIVNQDTSWGRGAFTNNKDTSQFDYGWGRYNSSTHFLEGDSLYLVKANGVFYQLWIQKYVSFGAPGSIGYTFRVAKWDGTGDKTDSIKRVAPYTDRLFAYYDFASGTFSDREPSRRDWDLLFRQYQKDGQAGGQNPNALQAYTGVLVNLNVSVAKVTGVDPNSISSSNYQTHISSMTVATNAIGDDWKKLNASFQYDIKPDTSFIIKTDTANGNNEYYLLRFTRFDGGFATGKAVFETKLLATIPVGVDDVANTHKATYSIYPNPAVNNVTIMVDAEKANKHTMLLVTDITGKTVLNTRMAIAEGLNGYSLDVSSYATGTYIVNLVNEDWSISEQIVVKH